MREILRRLGWTMGVGAMLGAVPFEGGCGDERGHGAEVASEVESEVESEVASEVESETESETETESEVETETETESEVETETETESETDAAPLTCTESQACNALLRPDGTCPGACFDLPDALTCRGTVSGSLCHGQPLTPLVTQEVDFGTFVVTPLTWPRDALVGETYRLELRLTNATDGELNLPFYWKEPGTWRIDNASWADVDHYTLPARASVMLTADITALRATVLLGGFDLIVTLSFAENRYEPTAVVHFPDTDPVCGDEHFPETYCPDQDTCTANHDFYVGGRCCSDVFYPGAACCEDADCVGGACIDGRCLVDAPQLGSANGVPLGHQRVVLVLVDAHPEWAADPCADRHADVMLDPESNPGGIDFAAIQAYYDDLGVRRFGAATMELRWTVLSGMQTSDFLTDADNHWPNYSKKLDAWLSDRGCPILGEFDKVIVASSTVDLQGFGGIYFDQGQIAIMGAENAYLVAHELAHSFGASDLYVDLGGRFQFAMDLMGNSLSAPPLPGDGVLWGEVGFADIDRNGVVDLAEFAAFPESLELVDATATLTTKGTLEIHWQFGGREGGVVKRLVVPKFQLDLPDFPAVGVIEGNGAWRAKYVVLDGTQVDLAALAQAGHIRTHVVARHAFTRRDWSRAVLTLDTIVDLPLVRAPEP